LFEATPTAEAPSKALSVPGSSPPGVPPQPAGTPAGRNVTPVDTSLAWKPSTGFAAAWPATPGEPAGGLQGGLREAHHQIVQRVLHRGAHGGARPGEKYGVNEDSPQIAVQSGPCPHTCRAATDGKVPEDQQQSSEGKATGISASSSGPPIESYGCLRSAHLQRSNFKKRSGLHWQGFRGKARVTGAMPSSSCSAQPSAFPRSRSRSRSSKTTPRPSSRRSSTTPQPGQGHLGKESASAGPAPQERLKRKDDLSGITLGMEARLHEVARGVMRTRPSRHGYVLAKVQCCFAF
jgi:hypothetical protein